MATRGKYGQLWTREELVLAFDLYCRIPFAKTKASNPLVKALAETIGRTPASVARKLGNFGAFDPALQAQGISGLGHGSKLDREVWDAFHDDWPALVGEAERLRARSPRLATAVADSVEPSGASEKVTTAKQRLHQSFFRQAVVSSYESRCCVTGLRLPECLIASHIIPWAAEPRCANPRNGLCLSATFDRLFDRGCMAIADDLTIVFSQRLLAISDTVVARHITDFNGRPICRPQRFAPAAEFLAWHRANIFTLD